MGGVPQSPLTQLYCGENQMEKSTPPSKRKCPHGIDKYSCKVCWACKHGVFSRTCRLCPGANICGHGKIRRACIDCHGADICEHKANRQRCKKCKGIGLCRVHNIDKDGCRVCGGYKVWSAMLLGNAKQRARRANLPFELTSEWVEERLAKGCPVFNRPFDSENRVTTFWSATIDKFKPELGYTPSNCSIICHLANRIKNSATREQVQVVLDWMKKVEADNERLFNT